MLLDTLQQYRRFWWLLAVAVWSGCVFAQEQPDPVSVQQYLELIDQEQDSNGLTSPALIEPLTSLGLQHFAQRDYELAAEAFKEARHITRINHGLDTLLELPLIAHLVRAEEAGGNLAEAWKQEKILLALAEQHVGKLETLPIFQELAQKRLELWERYRTGEIPPQILLGCYYEMRLYVTSAGVLRALDNSNPAANTSCGAGDRRIAQLALLLEARSFQMQALQALQQNDLYTSDELQQTVTEILRLSYSMQARGLGYRDPLLAQMMARLLSYEPQDSASRIRRAQFLLQLADMNIVRADEFSRYTGFGAVGEQYEQAYRALQNENFTQQQLDAIFAPALPVVLPSFTRNPLARVAQEDARGYIDVAFEITYKGKSRRINILETGGQVERSDQRELQRMIGLRNFRPRMVDGKIANAAQVTLRYYLASTQSPTPDNSGSE